MAQANVAASDFAQDAPNTMAPPTQSNIQNQTSQLNDTLGPSQQGAENGMLRANSTMSQSHTLTPSRGGTLKKRQSLSRKNSLKRTGSMKRPGSVASLNGVEDVRAHNSEMNNAFFTPVPTTGSPTEILAGRFQVWRKVLRDLIAYFRDVQKSYETRSKSLYTLSNVIGNITAPREFVSEGGISDAIHILRDYHKQSIAEGNKAKSIEEDVIIQLTGLRSDLGQKIKEIKGLSGDFKNSVDKETEGTRRAVSELQAALGAGSTDAKGDPFLVKLGVERQVGRQIEEENYLHRAFLNLESSGRELESIVMGEIQKAHSAYAAIIKREADEAYEAVEKLKAGPLAILKDHEWNAFVEGNEHFVDPKLPVRRMDNITYPGKDDAAASEVKTGMLERKSKYLKSYTPGWYVLSATHLHEFKSPDRISSQTSVMSLALSDQKLGSHSNTDSTSHKFMLKGRQSGGMHRGHAWVFRAESYDTMMAWFSDIKNLTEKTGEERNAFIRRSHARSVSGGSVSSDGNLDEDDEADQVPYSNTESLAEQQPQAKAAQRPNPGGRFPSALNVNRDSQVPVSPSSQSSSGDREVIAAAALPGSGIPFGHSGEQVQHGDDETNTERGEMGAATAAPLHQELYSAVAAQEGATSPTGPGAGVHAQRPLLKQVERHESTYGDWMGPAAAGGIASASEIEALQFQEDQKAKRLEEQPGLQTVDMAPPTLSTPGGTQYAAGPQTGQSPMQGGILNLAPNAVLPGDGNGGVLAGASDPELVGLPQVTRVGTVSDLHIPGEHPKGKPSAEAL